MSLTSVFPLDHRLANDSPWVRCGPLTVFVNKVLSEHSRDHSFTYCSYFHNTTAELSSCDRDMWPTKPIYHRALYQQPCQVLHWTINSEDRTVSDWSTWTLQNT